MKLLSHSKCPGKLILSGEHSTVYGKSSVAITVDLYTECQIFDTDDCVELNLEILDFKKSWPSNALNDFPQLIDKIENFHYDHEKSLQKIDQLIDDELKNQSSNIFNACSVFLLLYLSISDLLFPTKQRKCMKIIVKSQLPNGAGLGSSSAFIVSLAQALFHAYNVQIDKEEFNRWCWEMDKLFHGKPSGIDNSICTFGGSIFFQNGKIIERIDTENLPELNVILVNTMIPRNTKIMVERCRQRLMIFKDIGDQILDLMNSITVKVWTILKNEQTDFYVNKLSVLFEMNQNLLDCIDVGHEKITEIITIAKQYNLSAKLTGAGGGGIVMIYLNDCNLEIRESLLKRLHSNGFKTYQVKLGVSGVELL